MDEIHEHHGDHTHSTWCLLISTLVLSITAVTTNVLRSLIRYKFPSVLGSNCFLDFLCGLELCICGFELGVILDIYSVPVYSGFLWLVLVWQAISWGDATANPYSHLLRWRAGQQTFAQSSARVIAGAAGALSSYLVLAPLWKYGLSHFHHGRAENNASGVCGDDLQVSLLTGIVVELLGTTFCFLSGSILSDLPKLRERPFTVTLLDQAIGVALVVAAFDLTGGYYNPALALGIKLGCGQGGHLQHLAVYWVGPCIGALLAGPIYTSIKGKIAVKKEEVKEEKAKKDK